MTDADYTKTKRKVEKYLDKWRDAMGLGWYGSENLAKTQKRALKRALN